MLLSPYSIGDEQGRCRAEAGACGGRGRPERLQEIHACAWVRRLFLLCGLMWKAVHPLEQSPRQFCFCRFVRMGRTRPGATGAPSISAFSSPGRSIIRGIFGFAAVVTFSGWEWPLCCWSQVAPLSGAVSKSNFCHFRLPNSLNRCPTAASQLPQVRLRFSPGPAFGE